MNIRIGQGIDVHQLAVDESLIIGGVKIPSNKGSLGHSDGDILLHAITDAILGALALGDIGSHFPSESDQWKNAPSSLFLSHAHSLIIENEWKVLNIDSTIIAQEPILSEYIPSMIQNISKIINTPMNNISIKATTTDKLGFIGNGDGIACIASILITK